MTDGYSAIPCILPFMRSTRRIWCHRIAALCMVLLLCAWPLVGLAVFLTWIIFAFGMATWYQGYQGPSLERALGFKHGKRYRHGAFESSLAVRSVVDGGVFATAGIRPDDLLPGWSFTDFLRHLHLNRGRIVELQVADGDFSGPPFRARPRKTLRIAIPTLSEAPPTREDFLAAVSIWSPLLLMTVGGITGYFVSRAMLPAGPLWAQMLVIWLTACALSAPSFYLLINLANPSRNQHTPR